MGNSATSGRSDSSAATDDLMRLFDGHVGGVFGFVVRRCGDPDLAEDLTQEVFVAAALRARDVGELPAPAWLFEVARSRLIDHWRRSSSHDDKLRLIDAGSNSSDASDPAEGIAVAEVAWAALNQLPGPQRAALVLRYLDDYSVAQVAETLGRSPKATESLLARAKQNFRASAGFQDA